MSRVSTIPEIIEESADKVIEVFKGTIKNVYKRKEGQGTHGAWSFEDLIITNGANEIKLTLKDRDPLDPRLKGQKVYFLSYRGDKGWSGLKTKDDQDSDGNPRRILWCTKTCEIVPAAVYENGSGAQSSATAASESKPANCQAPSQTSAPAPQQPAPQKPAEPAKINGVTALKDAKVLCARRLSLMKIAAKAVLGFAEEFNASEAAKHVGVTLTGDQFWGRVTTLYISMEAEGLAIRRGFADALPVEINFADLKIVEKKPDQQPPQPPVQQAPAPPPVCQACNQPLNVEGKCEHCSDDVPF